MKQIEVNYKNKKRHNTSKYPIRQPFFITLLIWILSKCALVFKKYRIEKINMDNLKPPYLVLSNHMYFIDFELASLITFPHRVNNVINIDGYIHRAWLLDLIGGICTRKFSNDLHLIKSIKEVFKRKDVVGLYPEARYSACGITSYLPESLGKLIKSCKVPVVVIIHHGNHLHTPFWNFRKKRKVPLYSQAKLVLTTEDIEKLSVEEINNVIQEAFIYDDYKYQKDNNILITEKYRAEGIHKILYQCPHCKKEHVMNSKGTEIFCENCNKRWNLNEDGTISSLSGETEFDHVPDWYNWQKEEVIKQVQEGTYNFYDFVDVYSLPRTNFVAHLGSAKIRHTIEEGFVLEGYYNNQEYRIIRSPLSSNSLHVEYDYCHIKPYDCFVINTEDDCYFCYPKQKNVITKIGFAVEAIYQYHLNKTKNQTN